MTRQFISEVYEILNNKELKVLEENNNQYGLCVEPNIYEVRSKLTDSLTWIYPSVDNFKTIIKNINPNSNVLDIGCGSGILGKYLKEQYPNINYKGIRTNSYSVDDVKYCDNVENVGYTEFLFCKPESSEYDTWVLCWPPYDTDMAINILELFYTTDAAKKLIYIGELDGCNGDDRFKAELSHLLFEKRSGMNIEEILIDSYPGIRDDIFVITKQ